MAEEKLLNEELEEENETIEEFTWDDNETQLFEETEPEVLSEEEKELLKQKKDEKSTETDPSKTEDGESGKPRKETGKPDPDAEPEPEPFTEKGSGEEDKRITDDKQFFKTLATELKSAGIFQNVEIKDNDEIDQDKFIELQDAEVEARVDEAFESFFSELDDDGKRFLKFKKEGGDTKKFFDILKMGATRPTGDISDKKVQENIVRHYLSAYENTDDSDINDRIEWLESTGKLEKFAKAYDEKMKKVETERLKELQDLEEARKVDKENARKAFVEKLGSTLKEKDDVNGIPINKKDKEELVGYITKPVIKIAPNRFITQFQNDLREATGDHETLLILAKLIKSKFDLKDIKVNEKTKVVKDLKDKLDNSKQGFKQTNSGSSRNKSLTDYF